MPRPYKPLIPQTVGEVVDHVGMMMLKSPTFEDDYFVHQNIETVFTELKEGLGVVRQKLGEERYQAAIDLADRMRALFEADPEDANGQAREGRKLIQELEDLLKGRAAKA